MISQQHFVSFLAIMDQDYGGLGGESGRKIETKLLLLHHISFLVRSEYK